MSWQRYTDPVAVERLARGDCPECGLAVDDHTGWGAKNYALTCNLTDTGVAGRVWQYREDQKGVDR